ncbi:TIGR04283 family arsenosugar biosynthesis glycosyltransferase [Rhodovibrionaceae bacterium A322]
MISIIIPTLNEAANLPALLTALQRSHVDKEILVIDGGSQDSTTKIAADLGAKVLTSAPGRGRQLVTGAEAATGDILWFLHADSQVKTEALEALQQEMAKQPEACGGNFRLLFDGQDSFSRWLDGFYARIRSKGVYYGDSGIFVRREVYQAMGGLKPLALMEDYDFNRRLERYGQTLLIQSPALVTSSRRFQGRKKWRIISQWIWMHALFHLGVPDSWLARLYNSSRRSGKGGDSSTPHCSRNVVSRLRVKGDIR